MIYTVYISWSLSVTLMALAVIMIVIAVEIPLKMETGKPTSRRYDATASSFDISFGTLGENTGKNMIKIFFKWSYISLENVHIVT